MDPPEQDDGPIDPTNSSDELDAPDENAANMMSAAGDFSDEEPPPPAPIVDLYRLRGQSWSAFIDQMPEQLYRACTSLYIPTYRTRTSDVSRLFMEDYNNYGVDVNNPPPMVVCDICSCAMTPEQVVHHAEEEHNQTYELIDPTTSPAWHVSLPGRDAMPPTSANVAGSDDVGPSSASSSSTSSSATGPLSAQPCLVASIGTSLSPVRTERIAVDSELSSVFRAQLNLPTSRGNERLIDGRDNDNSKSSTTSTSSASSSLASLAHLKKSSSGNKTRKHTTETILTSAQMPTTTTTTTTTTIATTTTNNTSQINKRLTNNSKSAISECSSQKSTNIDNVYVLLNKDDVLIGAQNTSAQAQLLNATATTSSSSNSPIGQSRASTTGGRRKVLPVKERKYDPEVHCGVVIEGSDPCTRSLTCKTHQVSLRRAVSGRSKPFDELLAERRESNQRNTSQRQVIQSIGGDNSNQTVESIGDSNSSSSYDMDRRNVPKKETDAEPNDAADISMFPTEDTSVTQYKNPTAFGRRRKISASMMPSPDNRSNISSARVNDSHIMSATSIMQSPSIHSQSLNSTALNVSSNTNELDTLNNVSQLSAYFHDDTGECLDISFWNRLESQNLSALDHLTETPKAQSTNDTNSAKKSQHIDHHHFDYHHHENESKPARKRKHGRKDKHSHSASNKLRKSSSGRDEVINIDTDNDIHADNVTEIEMPRPASNSVLASVSNANASAASMDMAKVSKASSRQRSVNEMSDIDDVILISEENSTLDEAEQGEEVYMNYDYRCIQGRRLVVVYVKKKKHHSDYESEPEQEAADESAPVTVQYHSIKDVNDRRTKTERNEKAALKKGREKAHNLDIYIDNNGNFLFASVNGRQVPRSSRVLLASRGYVIPVPMQINHYNMGRKNGSCHFSNTMDITGEKMMQAFERYQMQTASGVPIKREDINVKANGVIEYKNNREQRQFVSVIPKKLDWTMDRTKVAEMAAKNAAMNATINGTPLFPVMYEVGNESHVQSEVILDKYLETFQNTKRPVYMVNNADKKYVILVGPAQFAEMMEENKIFTLIRLPESEQLHFIRKPTPDGSENEYRVVPIEHSVRNSLFSYHQAPPLLAPAGESNAVDFLLGRHNPDMRN